MLPTFAAAPTARPASEASINYLRSLMLDKATTNGSTVEAATEVINEWLSEHNSQSVVSFHIDRLKREGFTGYRAPAVAPVAAEVPAGRYAVATESGAINELAFYKVDRPTEGKWAGYVFVKLLISDDEQRMSRAAGETILRKIAAVGPEVASAAYGQHIGECGVCGRTLTNDESRAYGIGPDCRKKLGW